MKILEQVRALIERLSPHPVCEDCITQRLELGERKRVDQKAHELIGTPGFEWYIDVCSLCSITKKVIRKGQK